MERHLFIRSTDWKSQQRKMSVLPKLMYRTNMILIKIPARFFYRCRQDYFKMHKKNKETTKIAKSSFEKEEGSGKDQATQFQGCSHSHETVWYPQRDWHTDNGTEQGTWEQTHKNTPNLFLTKVQKQFERKVHLFNKWCWSNEWLDSKNELDRNHRLCTKLTQNSSWIFM